MRKIKGELGVWNGGEDSVLDGISGQASSCSLWK